MIWGMEMQMEMLGKRPKLVATAIHTLRIRSGKLMSLVGAAPAGGIGFGELDFVRHVEMKLRLMTEVAAKSDE